MTTIEEMIEVAADRDRLWDEYRALRAGRLMLVPVQRTDFPCSLNLREIRAQYQAAHRTLWQRRPQLRWPW